MDLNNNSFLNRIFGLRFEAGWVALGQIGGAAGALFGVKLLTHFLSPYEFGLVALANTLILAVIDQVFGPLGHGLMRFWSIATGRDAQRSFIILARRFSTYATLFVMFVAAVAAGMVAVAKGLQWAVLVALALMVGNSSGWAATRVAVLAALRRRRTVAVFTTCIAFLKPVAGIGCVLWFRPTGVWVMVGYLVTTTAGLYVIERFYLRAVRPEPVRNGDGARGPESPGGKADKLGREMAAFALPFFLWASFGWMHEACDRWALQYHYGADLVGAYFVVRQLAVYPLILLSGFLTTFLAPIAYERAGALTSQEALRAGNRILRSMTLAYIAGAMALIALFWAFSRHLVLVLSNDSYLELAPLLPGLTAACSFFYLGQTMTGFGMLANKPRLYLLPKMTAALLAAGLSFSLPALLGPAGVVWALGAAGLVYASWCTAIAYRLMVYAELP